MDIRKTIALLGLLIGGMSLVAVLYLFDPAEVAVYPTCPFHELTGLDCPGCGATRATHQLLHGNISAALKLNAFAVLSLPLLAGLGAHWLWGWIRRKQEMVLRPAWIWIYFAVYLAFGVLRDLTAPVLARFSP
jgi:hypothetical protein